jgi:predicted CXXCH cytochrome family protein
MYQVERRRARLTIAIGLAAVALACGAENPDPVLDPQQQALPDPPTDNSPKDRDAVPARGTLDESYVGSVECGRCHADQYAKWSGSHHDLAMQVASDATVLGDFDDAEFSQGDAHFQFSRRDGRFWVRTQNSSGEPTEFEIEYTFGVEPLQQYLVRFPRGRYQPLSVAWDTRPASQGGKRWFHLYADDPRKPGDPFHWTGGYQTWNHMCAECHSTNLEKHFDPATESYATQWAEIDVACEACHGPGSLHVAGAAPESEGPVAMPVAFSDDSRHEVDTCAPCHSRRRRVSTEDRTGRPLLDDFLPVPLRAGLYHSDGQILEEVYVYGSFVQSAMFARGVACSDCHDPHSLELRVEGNGLCMQCHSESGNDRFPSLTKKAYDTEEHHFHPAGSAGAQCVSCHMPAQTYMQVDDRRDHSFRIPRPDVSAVIGTPNACTGCHTDKEASWAAGTLTQWYGPAANQQQPHFALVIDAARNGSASAIPELTSIASDPEQPVILRATALELLSGFGPSTAATAVAAMQDADPMVRATAARALALLDPERQVAVGAALLRDPVRAVRLEAARALASAEIQSPAVRRALDAALAEYIASQQAETDTPSAHLNLAVLAAQRGEHESAIASYRKAIELDPDFFPARANLAVLLGSLERRNEAELLLREGIAREPDRGEFHYSLGLVLAEGGRFESAAGHIGRAAELMPTRARVQYNLGLALQRIDKHIEAERALLEASRLAPRDPEFAFALATTYMQRGQWEQARAAASRLIELTRGAPQALDLMRQIERELVD